jgi:hypothetical protein
MIDVQKRRAIYYLFINGTPIRKIARDLNVDRNTVRKIIAQKGEIADSTRCDKIELDSQLLSHLYRQCDGYVERIHEKLEQEHGQRIGYSTLTAKIRELELGKPANQRCEQVADQPGAEMQHDTSVYRLKLGDKSVKLVGSLLYYRYCKIRYLKFYRFFNRFKMKCFFHEALMFFKYSAPVCIIDNTNLARLRGTGKNAVMVAEMEQFAKGYGFEFVCHKIGHANRKAGNERSFYTVETNFFPGRRFNDMEDLNRQAFEWATIKMANRPVAKTGLIPAKAFEHEQLYLNKLPAYLSAPYLEYQRGIDQYGYISFEGNFYWVPGLKRHDVKVIRYAEDIKIYHQRKLMIEYKTAPDDVKNKKFSPPGCPQPKYQPRDRKNPTSDEEQKLRSFSEKVDAYLTFALSQANGKQKHRVIRNLYCLLRKMSADLFEKTIDRALTYRITDTNTIERIAALQIRQAGYQMPWADIDEAFIHRPSFLEGRFSDEADLSVYKITEENEDGSGNDNNA